MKMTTVVAWEAMDGTIFNSSEEAETYEKTLYPECLNGHIEMYDGNLDQTTDPSEAIHVLVKDTLYLATFNAFVRTCHADFFDITESGHYVYYDGLDEFVRVEDIEQKIKKYYNNIDSKVHPEMQFRID